MESINLVSICIPVYNGARFLPESLDSMVGQSYPEREIIVSDNASTDNTPDIIREYQKTYPIKYFRNAQAFSAGEYNFNRCVQLARGEAVCIFHADDLYDPDIVLRQAALLMKYPNVGAVFAMADVIDEQGNVISRYALPPELKRLHRDYYHFHEIFSCILKYENSFLVCPSPMVRKSVYEALGAWEYEKYRFASDLGLWFKIAQKYDIAIIDEPLVKYRISLSQGSQVIARQRTGKADYFLVMDAFADKVNGHKNQYYLQASLMKDCVYRALNLSLQSLTSESNGLAQEALKLYRDNFFPLLRIPKTIIYFFIALLLRLVNRIPFKGARSRYHAFVFKLVGLKKHLFSY